MMLTQARWARLARKARLGWRLTVKTMPGAHLSSSLQGDSIMDDRDGLRLKWRLRCGLGGRLLEWHSWTSSREELEKCVAHPD